MKILYFDPIFGISGDMTISAFLDAGMPFAELNALLALLPVEVPPVRAVKKQQGMLEGTQLVIGESDVHLSPGEMKRVVTALPVEKRIKDDVLSMLAIITAAEAKVHGVSEEEVHFHELSHIDTLIDFLCVAGCMHYFGIGKAFSGPVPCGRGSITTAHGVIPNPPPAVVEILKGRRLGFHDTPLELTTPTGAAIIRHYASEVAVPPFTMERVGCGMGGYTGDFPDMLRIFIGESEEPAYDEEVWELEADMDDMETEYIGAVCDRIRAAGALDALFFPVHMKKGRLGLRLSVTAHAATMQGLVDLVFRETSTFGVRMTRATRRVLKRSEEVLHTSFGPVRVKRAMDSRGVVFKTHYEFEDVRSLSVKTGIPFRSLLELLKKETVE